MEEKRVKKLEYPFKQIEYEKIKGKWPRLGHCILASYDPITIVLYLPVPIHIGKSAVHWQSFRRDNTFLRMSWRLTPTFLSVMYKTDWAQRKNEECILALTILRSCFEDIIRTGIKMQCVLSPDAEIYWEFEHDPMGKGLHRSAIQFTIRELMVEKLIDQLLDIQDVTPFVKEQLEIVENPSKKRSKDNILFVPYEMPYQFLYPEPAITRELLLDNFTYLENKPKITDKITF